ncbi:MAG: hypothetical protein ABW019_12125 [Chitinophagaceae bacterium]
MSSWQHKMKNYEVAPPDGGWEKIVAALDEEAAGDFASRLYQMEVPPPAAVWGSIAAALPDQAPAVPMRKRASGFLRYAVAAAFIGIAAFGIVRWLSNGPEKTGVAQATTPNPAPSRNNPSGTIANNTDSRAAGETTGSAAEMGADAHLAVAPSRRTVRTTGNNTTMVQQASRVYAYEDHLPDMASRYITLMTPSGHIIRMSKKWEDLICCVSGEEQNDDCKTQLRQWQEKIAASPQATSNFLDILSLVNSLDDNTDL